mmetsp:Transcript_73015/g.191404  ORF Transcript_73015/g.191404 Transcript_73015/m.191404 type:complete len:348 (-) Transcript_73015:95-1138(-)
MAPNRRATRQAPPKYDLSAIIPGTKIQASAEGIYYTAEVVQASTAKARARAPVKVHFLGYTDASDEWVGLDRIRSKAIKALKKVKEPAEKVSSMDTDVTLYPYFAVPEGRMEEFKAGFQAFHDALRPAEEKIRYFGFSVDEENRVVHCREAYGDAEGLLAHLKDVDGPFKKALEIAALQSISVSGPAAELEKLKEALTPLGCKFMSTDAGARTFAAYTAPTKWDAGKSDTSVVVLPYFKVKNMAAYKASLEYFSRLMNPKREGAVYYGFAIDEDGGTAVCKGAYKNGQGFLTHLKNVRKPFDVALALADLAALEVHGPAAELEKMREALTPLGAKWFVRDAGCKCWI